MRLLKIIAKYILIGAFLFAFAILIFFIDVKMNYIVKRNDTIKATNNFFIERKSDYHDIKDNLLDIFKKNNIQDVFIDINDRNVLITYDQENCIDRYKLFGFNILNNNMIEKINFVSKYNKYRLDYIFYEKKRNLIIFNYCYTGYIHYNYLVYSDTGKNVVENYMHSQYSYDQNAIHVHTITKNWYYFYYD